MQPEHSITIEHEYRRISSSEFEPEQDESYKRYEDITTATVQLARQTSFVKKKRKERISQTCVSIVCNENTPLLHSVYISNVYQITDQKRSFKTVVYVFLLAMVLISATFVAFTCQKLNVKVGALQILTRTPELFEFDVELTGSNANLVRVELRDTDIDVFATMGVSDQFDFMQWEDSTPELLGHVREFNKTANFKPIATTTTKARISILDPYNTLGKLYLILISIYMHFPFTVVVRGKIWYSFFSILEYSINVCSYYQVLDDTATESHLCIL